MQILYLHLKSYAENIGNEQGARQRLHGGTEGTDCRHTHGKLAPLLTNQETLSGARHLIESCSRLVPERQHSVRHRSCDGALSITAETDFQRDNYGIAYTTCDDSRLSTVRSSAKQGA